MLKKSLALVYQSPSNAGHSQNHKIDTPKTFMGLVRGGHCANEPFAAASGRVSADGFTAEWSVFGVSS